MSTTPALFEWLHALPLSSHIRESLYLFPALDVVHVVGIILLAGSIAVVDLRLLGTAFGNLSIARVSAQVLPLTWLGALLTFGSGVLLFLPQAEIIWSNPMLQTKLALLVLAALNIGLWHWNHSRHREWDLQPRPPWQARLAGGTSLLLWTAIIIAGRLIAFIF